MTKRTDLGRQRDETLSSRFHMGCLTQLLKPWLVVLALLLTAVSACQSDQPADTAYPVAGIAAVKETAIIKETASVQETATNKTPTGAVTTATSDAYPVTGNTSATPDAYPVTDATTAAPSPYPVATAVPPAATPLPDSSNQLYLPFLTDPMPTATPTDTPTPTATPTPIPTVDFSAARAQLQAAGQELAFVKIGFHAGIGGNSAGLERWMRRLDEAGVPFFLKSADNAQPLYLAQEMMKKSGVPHTLVYRRAAGGDVYNVPNYELPPEQAAVEHWQRHVELFPPELDPSLVWMETVNEVDKNRSEWLAQFSLKTAELALAQGRRWAAFGWSSGEPEPEHWESPAMLEFLRLAGNNPDQIAIALHEYSYVEDDIAHQFPYKVGRFLELFRICDKHGIPRPTVLITEWGWTYQHVPSPEEAIDDIAWASRLYGAYPQVKGAAIWYLGNGYGDIEHETQRLIKPLMIYSLTHYVPVSPPSAIVPANPELYRP